jgi:chitodextrinase
MAWRAYLLNDIELSPEKQYIVDVAYYDDADPANANVSSTVPPSKVLWEKQWTIGLDATTAQLIALVVGEGQSARTAVTKLAGARAAVPRGATVAVP